MTKTNHLIRIARLMSAKYAGLDASTIKERVKEVLQTAIGNASTARIGILPFLQMLKADQAQLAINITRNSDSVSVSLPSLDKPELTAKYAPLSEQIKTWLEKNLEVFPTKMNGENVEYHNLTITLNYADNSALPVATL
jgi:hypothetical protein